MKYFTDITTLDALKAEYRRLVLKHHPDCGGDTETMKQINLEYERTHEQLKHAWNTTHDAEHQCTEAPEEFRDIIEALLKMGGVEVELCGCWLWISGNTYAYKDQLKALGCSWASKKKMWSWHHKERRYALWEVAPEVRCHIYNKVYVGVQFKAGSFNYKLGGKGRQGDLMGGGFTLGCVLPMGRHCAVDLGMALGGLHASYDVYTVAGRHRIRTGSVSKNWWGPTDVGLTLVYNLK